MKKVIFICDNCKSEDIDVKHVTYNEKYEKRQSVNLDHTWTECVSHDEKDVCVCRSCGYEFTEYL